MSKTDDEVVKLRPDIKRLIAKAEENPMISLTGFVFCPNPRLLIHFGNIQNRGMELRQLHVSLSELAGGMQTGYINTQEIAYVEIGANDKTALAADPIENIADDLAKKIIITGLEPQHNSEIFALAERYLMARGAGKS